MCVRKPVELVGGVPAELLAAIPVVPTELTYQNRLQVLQAVSGRDFIDRGDWYLGTWTQREDAVLSRHWELYVPSIVHHAVKEPGKWDELRAIAFLRLHCVRPPHLDIAEDSGVALIRVRAYEPDFEQLIPWVEKFAVDRIFPDLTLTLRQYVLGQAERANVIGQ